MAFYAQPDAYVTAWDRVIQLRDFLETLPPERFNMGSWGKVNHATHTCDTPACIRGWAEALFSTVGEMTVREVGTLIGLDDQQSADLFQSGYALQNASKALGVKDLEAITVDHAVAVLDHYLLTGKIDWGVAR